MATYTFDSLKTTYGNFIHPEVVVEVNGKELTSISKGYPISDIDVDLSCGYEASVAEFSIYHTYDVTSASFDFEGFKKYVLLGSSVDISMGYGGTVTQVFLGVITRVSFRFEKDEIPCVRVTAMDVKGVMMSGSYSKQLTATTYSDAVKEILERTAYEKLKSNEIIRGINVTDTPDKSGVSVTTNTGQKKASDRTIEIVAESDYEFIVKLAKRYNYEFFVEGGFVYFRKAKAGAKNLLEIGPDTGMYSFDVSYDLTGLVEKVIVRGMNVSQAKVITSDSMKFSNKISQGSKANNVIRGSQRVYIDSTITSTEDANYRAKSLMEKISYRYGSLICEMVGIPELLPGNYITLSSLGTAVDNKFYLTRVRHRLQRDGQYIVCLEGQAASAQEEDTLTGLI